MSDTVKNPAAYLEQLGHAAAQNPADPVDIAQAALMLAALDHSGLPLEPARAHLAGIAEAMAAQGPMILRVGDGARALSTQLSTRLGYDGDRFSYDDPRNADLIQVIERRLGLPVTLGILYMHAARAAGMAATGLNTQSHFLVRIGHRHDDVTIDPFNGGAILEIGHPLPAALGDAHLAEPVGDIDVLLRLQNNLKIRALEKSRIARALEIAGRMTLIAPQRPDVWFDLARLNEANGVLGASRRAYERCMALSSPGEALHNEAAALLAHLKRRLN
jgi:regulator of sirC expression with transglutaminase-like and TPR domain